MIKKIHVLIALYSLISHSVESVAAEPEGVEPRRVLTLKEQIPTWHHYSDLPTVCGQKVVDFLNFSDKTNLQTIDQINSYIIENKYKDKDSPFLKIQSALLFFFDGIRENNSAAFKMYVSPKLSSSDSFFCLQHLYAQGFVSKKIVDDAEKKWHLSRKKSLAPYNQERVFEKTLGFLWEGWQYYLFHVNSYFKRHLDVSRLDININKIYADVDTAEFRQELKRLAELGWTEAQGYVAAGVAQGTYGFKKDPIELKRLAELGWPEAQEYVAEGLATNYFGFTQDLIELKRLAELGWTDAQKYVAEGLANGSYDFTQDPIELKRLAELGWPKAQKYVAAGLANGDYSFTQDPIELKRLAELGWTEAQEYVVAGLAQNYYGFKQNPIELARLAKLGWTEAREYVAAGLAEGTYGFKKDPIELKRLAYELGWIEAQNYVASGFSEGDYDFTKDTTKLMPLAKLGWIPAQEYVVDGIAEGKFGFKKNPTKLIAPAHLGWTPAQEYVESNYYIFRDIIKPKFLKLLEQTAKWVPSRDFANLILGTIPLTIDKLAFALHMACLEQSRKG